MKKLKLLTFNSFNCEISKFLSNNNNLLLAISGGMDSVVLLHLSLGLRPRHKLYAVHVNHGLRSESTFEQKFVKNLCSKYNIPLLAKKYCPNFAYAHAFGARGNTQRCLSLKVIASHSPCPT